MLSDKLRKEIIDKIVAEADVELDLLCHDAKVGAPIKASTIVSKYFIAALSLQKDVELAYDPVNQNFTFTSKEEE